jgi:hypothetical protein
MLRRIGLPDHLKNLNSYHNQTNLIMKKNLIYFLLSCSIVSFSSCEKDNDDAPISDSGSKEHYMPVSIGNSWTYNSASYGEYTVSVTGKEEINNKEYYTLSNSLSSGVGGYLRYQGNKLYMYSTVGGTPAELLIVDEDATAGQEWEAGKVAQSQPNILSYAIKYTGKFVQYHETYTFKGKSYTNVMEINLKTTIQDFELGSYYTSMFSGEELALLKTQLENQLKTTTINQTQFYAKGIGYVNQVSETMPSLNVELKDYTIK